MNRQTTQQARRRSRCYGVGGRGGHATVVMQWWYYGWKTKTAVFLSHTHTNQHTRTRRANLHPPSHQHETLHHLSFFLRFTSACMSAREHSVVCLLCLLMMFWGMHSTHQTDGSLKSKGSMRNKVSHLGRSTDLPKTKTRFAGRG